MWLGYVINLIVECQSSCSTVSVCVCKHRHPGGLALELQAVVGCLVDAEDRSPSAFNY